MGRDGRQLTNPEVERVTGIEPASSAWEPDERGARDQGKLRLNCDFSALVLTALYRETPFVTALSGTELAREALSSVC